METKKTVNDRYEFLSVLYHGNSSAIYLGHDSVRGNAVAIKEISQDLLADSWYAQQLQVQIQRAAKMNHQNIVHVLDWIRADDGAFYIVTEYVDGIDLMTLRQQAERRSAPIPQHLGVHIISEVCKALDYAHNCYDSTGSDPSGLVHKCISPRNIILSRSGTVKLNDFGVDGIQTETNINLPWKVQYMSPEHVSYGTSPDKRSDLFSLGLILYEILEGKPFFSTEDPQEIIAILRNGGLELKDTRLTPKPLQRVLAKALEKSPDDRYQNANQLYIDLVTFLVLNADTSVIDKQLSGLIDQLAADSDVPPTPQPTPTALPDDRDKNLGRTEDDHRESPESPLSKTEPLQPPAPEAPHLPHESAPSINLLPDFEPNPMPPDIKEDENDEGDDDVKTVIDVVRLSTRGHKKQVMKGVLGATTFLLLFLLLDFGFQWTPVGAKAYDMVFPPAIKISSIPAGAKAFLDGRPLPGTTPISIDKIDPGVHELRLESDRYEAITRSIHVLSKGEIEVQGALDTKKNPSYVFRFKTALNVDSTPQGADVYINDVRYTQTTPCVIPWQVGETVNIELKKQGYENLSGFSLASEQMVERIEDRRFWEFSSENNPHREFNIHGRFGKFFIFDSRPAGAEIYLDDNQTPVGTTGGGQPIFLTAAPHRIELRKRGYNPSAFNLTVDETSKTKAVIDLTRPVRFLSYDASKGKSTKLGAVLKRLSNNGKTVVRNKRTPQTIDLKESTYVAHFSKAGFKDLKLKVTPKDSVVIALMEPLTTHLYVVIIDEESGMPVSNAEVRYKRVDQSGTREGVFNVTDAEGTCHGTLLPGRYQFSIIKNHYQFEKKTVDVRSSEVNLIEFTLTNKNRG